MFRFSLIKEPLLASIHTNRAHAETLHFSQSISFFYISNAGGRPLNHESLLCAVTPDSRNVLYISRLCGNPSCAETVVSFFRSRINPHRSRPLIEPRYTPSSKTCTLCPFLRTAQSFLGLAINNDSPERLISLSGLILTIR